MNRALSLLIFAASTAIAAASGDSAAVWAFQNTWSSGEYSNDCVNFVSKSLLAGSWTIIGHPWSDRLDTNLWFQYWLLDPKDRQWKWWRSASWRQAASFEAFLKNSGRGVRYYNSAESEPGDIVVADWEAGDWNNPAAAIANGTGDHVMIVHQNLGDGDVICCQHSHNRLWSLNVLRQHFTRASFRLYHTFGHNPLDNLTEGRMYRESSHNEVYVYVNRGLLWLTTLEDVIAWGGWGAIQVVPNGRLNPVYGGRLPLEGTMVRERNHPEVWLVRANRKCWISTEWQVDHFGTWKAVRVVPNGSLGFFARGPDVTDHP